MSTFIEDYLHNPSEAIQKARECVAASWEIDENSIYKQLSTPEFRLYEVIAL